MTMKISLNEEKKLREHKTQSFQVCNQLLGFHTQLMPDWVQLHLQDFVEWLRDSIFYCQLISVQLQQ